jgi:hypothetical protein
MMEMVMLLPCKLRQNDEEAIWTGFPDSDAPSLTLSKKGILRVKIDYL